MLEYIYSNLPLLGPSIWKTCPLMRPSMFYTVQFDVQ